MHIGIEVTLAEVADVIMKYLASVRLARDWSPLRLRLEPKL